MPTLYTARQAAEVLGISYATLKQWIYQGKIKSFQTSGGHHRIQESEIERLLPYEIVVDAAEGLLSASQRVSENHLLGRVTDIQVGGLAAQVRLLIGNQWITSILSTDSLRALRLRKGQTVIAVINPTKIQVMRSE